MSLAPQPAPCRALSRPIVLIPLLASLVLCGCGGTRTVDGWQRGALAAHSAAGESITQILAGGIEPGEERDARETLRAIYFLTSRLDYIAANKAGVKRSDTDWEEMAAEVELAYEALAAASSLPRDQLAVGLSHPEIVAAADRVRTIERRFGGAPPPRAVPARITP